MSRFACTLLTAVSLLGAEFDVAAQSVSMPLENRPDAIRYNLTSTNGMPISHVRGQPQGSDGRAPRPESGSVGTTNQFQGLLSFGGVVGPGRNATNLDAALSYAANATNLNLPRDQAGGKLVLLRGRLGNPLLGRGISFRFGDVIPPPDLDEYGVELSKTNVALSPPRLPALAVDYWLPEPYTTTDHKTGGYYWSLHAERVYATETGPIEIVWRKAQPSLPVGSPADVGTVGIGGSTYTLYTNRYVVSTVVSKPPRRMYWTEGPFTPIGKVILVPTDRVGNIQVVYHRGFPEVTNEFRFDGKLYGSIEITNTLWYDRTYNMIRAYNVEGRVFVELLGDRRGQSGNRDICHQLGYEIIDLIQRPVAEDVTVELGNLMTPFQGEPPEGTPELYPDPVLPGEEYAYRHGIAGTSRFEYFAIRETVNQNDSQVHWMEEGLQGLLWPYRFVRYRQVWPSDVSRYTHYLRPRVNTEEEAKATAVVLPSANAPAIAYQDPLDRPRGKLTENFAYYSFLDPEYPAHRALLVLVSGEYVRFEPVFSWLDQPLREPDLGTTSFARSVATNLSAWRPSSSSFHWPEEAVRPRVVTKSVPVGDRIAAPLGELGAAPGADYLAGYIRETEGDSYHPGAYVNPFVSGFDLANRGAIIPVNAIPGASRLEVWWFRQNAVDTTRGFETSYWPAVIGRYTIEWPSNPSEIVLAGNDGSGPLNSLEAKGSIYYENDRSKPGYNPNEEHALMQGGQAFALRDDLNIASNTNGEYSSHPFVLLEYTAADGKTAIRPFRVRREKPEAGITFEYAKPAGSILQAPMPLPLLGPAFAPKVPGTPRQCLNEEVTGWAVVASDRDEGNVPFWTMTTEAPHGFRPFRPLVLVNGAVTRWFYPAQASTDTLRGVVAANRPLELASSDAAPPANTRRWRFSAEGARLVSVGQKALLALPAAGSNWVVTVTSADTNANVIEVEFGSDRPGAGTTNAIGALLVPAASGYADGAFNGWRLAWNEALQTTNTVLGQRYASATLEDRKGNTWVYRGPHRADRPETFGMRFYYNTLPGFFFPSLDLAGKPQPPTGTPTPYLRPTNQDGQFVGDPVYGNRDQDQSSDGNALCVTYHPVWPDSTPTLQMAETLTTPKRGLPAVRGQTSLEVLYQQSHIEIGPGDTLTVNTNPERSSAVLHDPTREKTFAFDPATLPGSIKTETARGKVYFPNLPPHLVKRFYLDPNRGANGALVFAGAFVDAALGDKYVLLNVAGAGDVASLKGLCADEPSHEKSQWDAAIDQLATALETFVENPGQPGTFIPSVTNKTVAGLGNVAAVTDDDVAVDSYALTAIGPESGFVSLIAGNGEAFTPEGDPVSVHVIRVVPDLYRGEVNVIESENPLNEKLTLQQVVDLAGQAGDYDFEWRIAAPADGQPPAIYDTALAPLALDPWSHVRFLQAGESALGIEGTPAARVAQDVSDVVVPVSDIPFSSVSETNGLLTFVLRGDQPHRLGAGDRLVMASEAGVQVLVTVCDLPNSGNQVQVSVDSNSANTIATNQVFRLAERVVAGRPQSIVFTRFVVPAGEGLTELWLALDLAEGLGAKVYLNGAPAATIGLGEDDTRPQSPPTQFAGPRRYFRLPSSILAGATVGPGGERTNRVAVEFFSSAVPGTALAFGLAVAGYESIDRVTMPGSVWLSLDTTQYQDGVRAIVGGTADVRSLSDNYLTMRYVLRSARSDTNRWSQWTEPQLAEGWIKRVLKGINPFNQRVTDLFNNSVSTEISMLTQAGPRWEGDIALNLDSINDYGLIEVYETVLNRGKSLSIDAGINYGPANDALLLAAGYLNDLYMLVGNEAAADAANPTIGIGTKDNTYGDIATALFCFKGQLPSLLEEELALLRGRDDFLVPGVELRPVYNRLVWNYTRGIDAGEVIYALNYNILDQNTDGRVDAEDARRLFPQGHGDAYGHYLTALKGYYRLFLNPDFDWVPTSETVTVLGQPVSVDYQDERKFAAAAGALARTGKQVFDLTWRKDYKSGSGNGWSHFRGTRSSARRTRHWGLDHWAARTGTGAYLNWIVGNAIVPEVDPDPAHLDTIQQVDRTTVPELRELSAVAEAVQTALDNAESGMTPLGLPESAVPFDLNPNAVVSADNDTHFEQIYGRAKGALHNALVAFDDAKDVTRLMRSEQDSLADFRTAVGQQELAYTNALIELYGTPYPEDIGPGKTYRTGFAGPDTVHYMYIDKVELNFNGLLDPSTNALWRIDTQTFTANWTDTHGISDFSFIQPARNGPIDGTGWLPTYETNTTLYVEYNLAPHGFFRKPDSWAGKRSSPGKLQQAISDVVKARNAAFTAFYWADAAKYDLDWAIQSFQQKKTSREDIRKFQKDLAIADSALTGTKALWEIIDKGIEASKKGLEDVVDAIKTDLPEIIIAGTAAGSDAGKAPKAAAKKPVTATQWLLAHAQVIGFGVVRSLEAATAIAKTWVEFDKIAPEQWNQELRDATSEIRDKVYGMNNHFMTINARLQELNDAQRAYFTLLAEGDRIQQEREIFRQRAAAVIQGYRTRDAAFRIFRNEKLERYKTLFDLAAQYAFLAAKAYDYETGLLGTERGREFIDRIVNARALGVVQDGEPQFAGSNTGDPGLSSVLAEMHADWSVVKGRLGFNNPDAYGTTVSLRYENLRITTNDVVWQTVLNKARKDNLLDDPDVGRYCLQLDSGDGLPVPGLVFEFSTTIADGLNLFGHPLAAGDHAFSASSFATKVFAVGVALEGYVGMDDPAANSGAVSGAGASSPPDPSLVYLDPDALAATPYLYLIPVGVDSMRSPPLGDASAVRTWSVQDVAIPLPFNIGGSDFSNVRLWQASDSLTEEPFAIRKHQAFRPVSAASVFSPSIYTGTGGLQRSQFTNNRLIGRSVWNSRWKIVIPGRTLLSDPNEGIERFLRTVKDVKLHFVTYSYSGN